MYANLRCVCKNYAALGVQRFLLARAVEDRGQLEVWRNATSATETVVCRLISSIETMQRRIQIRETGVLRQQYIDRVAKLNLILDHARLEGFSVTNENRSLTDVAFEMLVNARWISN
jgi:hypothetical protein